MRSGSLCEFSLMSALIFNIELAGCQKDKEKMKTWEGRLVCMCGSHHEEGMVIGQALP